MIEKSIVEKLNQNLSPEVLHVENESHMHSGPRTESHFKVYLVSTFFEGLSRVDRQRKVNDLLRSEFEKGLHALSLRLKTPSEHSEKGVNGFVSPHCVSKAKS